MKTFRLKAFTLLTNTDFSLWLTIVIKIICVRSAACSAIVVVCSSERKQRKEPANQHMCQIIDYYVYDYVYPVYVKQ